MQEFNVINSNDSDKYVLCEGGVSAKYILSEHSKEVLLIPSGENSTQSDEVSPQVGQEVTIEAWCFANDNSEVGYAQLKGEVQRIGNLALQGIRVRNPQLESFNNFQCLNLTEQRGTPPCILTELIRVNN